MFLGREGLRKSIIRSALRHVIMSQCAFFVDKTSVDRCVLVESLESYFAEPTLDCGESRIALFLRRLSAQGETFQG